MLTIVCQRCGYKSSFCNEWSNHLLEYRHQSETRNSFLKWSHEDDVKSSVVYAHVDDKPVVVAEKFRSVSTVVDFVFWTNRPGLFIVQLETQEEADAVLNKLRINPDDMKIGGRDIQLRRKSDVLQNEWTLLIGYGIEREGSSKDPVCVVVSDDPSDDDVQGQSKNGGESAEQNENGNGSVEMEEGTPDPEEDFSINTEMSTNFSVAFLKKLKPEKKADNKKNIKENVKFMGKTWMDIYLDYHNKLWPICFTMGNSGVVPKSSKNSSGEVIEISFHCACLLSEDNEWLGKSKSKCNTAQDRKNFVSEKVNEFFDILSNETICSRRLKQVSQYAPRDVKKHLLSFSCSMTISYNSKGAVADLSFTNIQGKAVETKMILVTSIFKKLFKRYEKMRIDKWSLAQPQSLSNGVAPNKNWTQMIPID